MTDTKRYVPVVTQHNAKLLLQLKSGIKRTFNWNIYESKPESLRQTQYLNPLINRSFQGVNGLLVLSFENDAQKISYKSYYLPDVETKDYNIMIYGKTLFHRPVKMIK